MKDVAKAFFLFLGLLLNLAAAGQEHIRACEGKNLGPNGNLAMSIVDGPARCDPEDEVKIGDVLHVEFKAVR